MQLVPLQYLYQSGHNCEMKMRKGDLSHRSKMCHSTVGAKLFLSKVPLEALLGRFVGDTDVHMHTRATV